MHLLSHWAIRTQATSRTDSEMHSLSHWAIRTHATSRTDSEMHSLSHWAIRTQATSRTDSEMHSLSHWAIMTEWKQRKIECVIDGDFLQSESLFRVNRIQWWQRKEQTRRSMQWHMLLEYVLFPNTKFSFGKLDFGRYWQNARTPPYYNAWHYWASWSESYIQWGLRNAFWILHLHEYSNCMSQ